MRISTAQARRHTRDRRKTQIHQIAILVPLAVGAIAVMCTIFTRAIVVLTTVNFVRRQRRLGRADAGFWIDFSIVALAITVASVAHLIEIAY